LPPLRERREDILLLAKSFAERVYTLSPQVKFSPDSLQLLERYPWPGNIRELENAVVRASAICDGTIRVKDLPERVQKYSLVPLGDPKLTDETTAPAEVEDWTSLAEVEGRYVAKMLQHTGGNKQAAARLLEIDRKTLDRMIKRHNISVGNGNVANFPSRAA
jgi:DNA-binding NtrC family response regulator